MPKFYTENDSPNKDQVIELLNQTLADLTVMKLQLKHAHWNLKGIHFYPLHLLFDEVAAEVEALIDKVAERITSLGGIAKGLLNNVVDYNAMPVYKENAIFGKEHLESLIKTMGVLANSVRECIVFTENYNDPTTADLYTELSRLLDKRLWFLEAHLPSETK